MITSVAVIEINRESRCLVQRDWPKLECREYTLTRSSAMRVSRKLKVLVSTGEFALLPLASYRVGYQAGRVRR